jgi:hypothetical protein
MSLDLWAFFIRVEKRISTQIDFAMVMPEMDKGYSD